MSFVAIAGTPAQFEQFSVWHQGRPTQLAFAVSLLLHALFILLVPGFRSVPVESPRVLTVQIMNPEPVVAKQPVQNRPIQKKVEQPPFVREAQPLPELVPPPEFLPVAPQTRVVEQSPVRPEQVIEPVPVPVVGRPEQPVMEPVARTEFSPAIPRNRPQIKPVEMTRPDIVRDRPVVAVTEPQPVVEHVQVPVEQPREIQRRPRVVNHQAATPVQPLPAPDLPTPAVTPVQTQQPIIAAPAAPAPAREVASVVKRVTQPSPVVRPVATVTVAPAPPSAPLARPVVTAPIPVAPVVDTAVRDAYTESVKAAVTKNMSYPRVAKVRGWQGKTVVQMQLSEDGDVTDLKVAESSGKDVLDEAAITMVKRALPLPKPPRGVRTVNVPVVFRLQS